MTSKWDSNQKKIIENFINVRGWWDDEYYGLLLKHDPKFLEIYTKYSSHPTNNNTIPQKYIELILLAADMTPEVLHLEGAKIHIRNALKEGATPEEIIMVLELVSTHGIHSVVEGLKLLENEL